jgi:o-succinylbenzoate---CoA ligase
VRLSAAALIASAQASLDRLGGAGQWLSTLPASGVGGLQVLIRSALAGIYPVFLDDHLDLRSAVEAMDTQRRRYASFVPTQLFRLVNSGDIDALSGFDAVLLGGAAAPDYVMKAAKAAGVRIVRTYGMTETSGGCVYDGVPLDGVQVRIGDDALIEISGPVLFDGYGTTYRENEWFITSDLGRIETDGRLTVLGRADDVALTGGVNVPLSAVEALVRDHSAVHDAAAVALPDAEWGQRIVVAVVSDEPPTREQLRELAAATGRPREWVPRAVVAFERLPLLAGGKVDRRHLAELLADR